MDFFTDIIDFIGGVALLAGSIVTGFTLVAGGAAFFFSGLGVLAIAQKIEGFFDMFK